MAEQALKNSLLGEHLSSESLTLLAAEMEKKECPKDSVLIKEQTEQEVAFVIESGTIACLKAHPEGDKDPLVLKSLEQGDTSGFFHIFENDPAFYTLQVSSDQATVWTVSAERFKSLLKQSDAFFSSWLNYVHKQVRVQSKLIRSIQTPSGSSGRTKVAFFDSSAWTYAAFDKDEFKETFEFNFFKERLDENTASLAQGCSVVCCFVNDKLDESVLNVLHNGGVKMIALRCAGFDKVSIDHVKVYQMTVARVPAYSPYAVAEHAIALLLTLNRRIHRAYQRTRDANFDLRGLIGFDLYGKTAGVIGTGKIGRCLIDILLGFGCKVICFDIYKAQELLDNPKVQYVELDELYSRSDLISLHAPATDSTYHMINEESIAKMKKGVFIINTSRGVLVNTADLIVGLKSGQVGAAGLDVYEGESDYFFKDNSDSPLPDAQLCTLLGLPNVVVTGHQAFLTTEAINNIARTTVDNILAWQDGKKGTDHPNSIY